MEKTGGREERRGKVYGKRTKEIRLRTLLGIISNATPYDSACHGKSIRTEENQLIKKGHL